MHGQSVSIRIWGEVVIAIETKAVMRELTLYCVKPLLHGIILQVPPGLRVILDSFTFSQPQQSRLLLSAPCDQATPSFVMFYDSTQCATGCRLSLISGGKLLVQGGIEITSVRHRPVMSPASTIWDRRTLLQLLSLIHFPRPTRLRRHPYARFCL